jgi:hypothetical protein
MSSKDTSVKNRTSASGNEPTAELKNQVLENEMKLNELTVKVDVIIAEQVSMKEDFRAIIESLKLLEKSVSSLTLEVKELKGDKSVKVITSSNVSEEQCFDSEEFNVPSSESLNSSRHLQKEDLKAEEKKRLRRLSDNLFTDPNVNLSDEEDDREKTKVVEKDEVTPTDLPKYMQERNATLKQLKPDDVLKFLEAIDDYQMQGKKAVANVEKQFHMIISKELLTKLHDFNYATAMVDGGLEIGSFFTKQVGRTLTVRNQQHLKSGKEGIIFNNRTTLQQLQWKALRGLIVAYVTPKDMSGFCKTLYSVMKSRYTVGKKSILGRLPSITPESQIKQWPIFYEFLTTLAKVYSELFLWVQGNVFWGSTPLDIEWTNSTKANVKTTIKEIIEAHGNAYLKGLFAQVELMSAGDQSTPLVPQRGENVPFDYVKPKAKKQTAIFSASQFIEAMITVGRSDTEAAKAWKTSQSKTLQLNFNNDDSDEGERNVNELIGDFYDGYTSETEQDDFFSNEASLSELWTKHKIKGKNWDDVCWCLIFGDTCKGNCKPKSSDPDLDRAKASVYLLWQANKRLENARQHKKKIEDFQSKIKPLLAKRNQKIDWVWHEDEAKGSPTKPQREPPTIPGARKKQFNSLETPDEESEKDDFSAIAKGGDY